MKISELIDKLHHDPRKTIRTTELAVQHSKEKIEGIEQHIEMLKGLREKNKDGEYELSDKRKEEIKYWENILNDHKKFVAEKEEEMKEFQKELEVVDEEEIEEE